jgi:hypothetical protein
MFSVAIIWTFNLRSTQGPWQARTNSPVIPPKNGRIERLAAALSGGQCNKLYDHIKNMDVSIAKMIGS